MDAATRTQGVMLGDYDGDLEVCVVNEGSTNFLYRNGGHQGYWLQVAVEGVESNRDGIGIRLHAFAGGRRYTDEVNGTAGMSHSNRPVHLGLGAATRLDSLVVRWTNGQVDTYQGVEADGALRLVEGQRPVGGGGGSGVQYPGAAGAAAGRPVHGGRRPPPSLGSERWTGARPVQRDLFLPAAGRGLGAGLAHDTTQVGRR